MTNSMFVLMSAQYFIAIGSARNIIFWGGGDEELIMFGSLI